MNSSSSRSDRGFTAIELLVTISIVGLLIAILLPAVQSAREASRRLSCLDNLRQLGLSINNYNQISNCFPPCMLLGGAAGGGSNAESRIATNCYSPIVHLLPFVEQKNIFDRMNFSLLADFAAGLTANETAMRTSVSTLLCPSDSQTGVNGYGRTNYRYSVGPTTFLIPTRGLVDRSSAGPLGGAFATGTALRAADFPDGLSCTIGFSERNQGDWVKNSFSAGADYRMGSFWYQNSPYDILTGLCRKVSSDTSAPVESRGGESWCISGFHFTAYNHITSPNNFTDECGFLNYNGSIHDRRMMDGVFPPTSRHPRGVNVVRMDGSAKVVQNSVDLAIWRALGTRSGNEVIGSYE